MKLRGFAVYDSKAEVYQRPMFCGTRGEAVRAFADEVNREGSEMGRHPEDYTLFSIGEYDQATGFLRTEKVESLGNAVTYRKVLELPQVMRAEG